MLNASEIMELQNISGMEKFSKLTVKQALDREKLIELLYQAHGLATEASCFKDATYAQQLEVEADNLIANGVTVQEWIPVTERLPDENGYYLCEVCFSSGSDYRSYRRMILYWEDNVWIDMPNCFKTRKPTHWMPLPQPPKGE